MPRLFQPTAQITRATVTKMAAALLLASSTSLVPAMAQAEVAIEGVVPVELAVVDHSPITCQPDPLVLPSHSVVELKLINNSPNSTVINLDPLLVDQMVLEESDLASSAVTEMQDGFLIGPGQMRTLTIATLEPGSFEMACRSPAATDGTAIGEGINDFGVVRVE